MMVGYPKNTKITPDIISNQLKDQVINLLNDLMEIFPSDQKMLMARLYFENQVEANVLMKGFVKYVVPWKEKILVKDEKFFQENDHIFGDVESSNVSHFKNLYNSGNLSPDDKKILWSYFSVFISLVEKYKKMI